MEIRRKGAKSDALRWARAHGLLTLHRPWFRVTLKSRSSATPFGGLSRVPAGALLLLSPAIASGLMAMKGGTPP